MNDAVKKKIMDQKWERMAKEGIYRPESQEENKQLAEEAHVPSDAR